MLEMTRKEYESKYGTKPVLLSPTKIDTSVAPRTMTRAEYDAEFRPEVEAPKKSVLKEAAKNAYLNSPLANPLVKVAAQEGYTPSSYIKAAQEAGVAGVEQIKEGVNMVKKPETRPQGVMKTGAGIINALFSGVAPLMKPLSDLVNTSGEAISNIPAVQRFASTKGGETTRQLADFAVDATTVAGALVFPEAGLSIKGKPMATPKISERPPAPPPPPKATTKIAREIYDIENNYAKLRNANDYIKDAGHASRERIGQTDVLSGAVDSEGVIRTKQPGGAVEQYTKQTVDGVESVVRDNLVRTKDKVNLAQIERDLTTEIYKSGLEGADLITALKGVQKEIAGLKLRADEFGNVLLEKVHDAKISTTKNIDYNTPPETKTYRKAVARSYKKIVEDNSTVQVKVGDKTVGVPEINAELSKYYGDIERLANLDGRRVKGGKLGKYTAQISGNIIGGVAGVALGPLGMLVGPIVGGEAAGFLKGKAMASTFGRETGFKAAENPILAKARKEAGLPPVTDLKVPDAKVGVPKSVPKNKEMISVEKQIERNVEAQKKAIKAKDFTLVVALKEIYANLVTKLKDLIQVYKDIPNKQGGFIAFGNKETKVSGDIGINVYKELRNYKPFEPLSINGKPNMGIVSIEARLQDLQAKAKGSKASLTPKELDEAAGLLKQVGIDVTDYSNNLGNRKIQYNTTNIKPKSSNIDKSVPNNKVNVKGITNK